jgi:hypothetical protein
LRRDVLRTSGTATARTAIVTGNADLLTDRRTSRSVTTWRLLVTYPTVGRDTGNLVDQMCVSWNPLRSWLCQLDGLRRTDFVRQESTSLLTLEQDKIAEGLLSTENE